MSLNPATRELLNNAAVDVVLAANPKAFPDGADLFPALWESFPREVYDTVPELEVSGEITGGDPKVEGDLLACKNELVVMIGSLDDPKQRVLEAIEHLAVKCPGVTKTVVFYALTWSSLVWARHRDSFTRLQVECWLKMPFHDLASLR